MSEKTQMIITTAGSNVLIDPVTGYPTLSLPNWASQPMNPIQRTQIQSIYQGNSNPHWPTFSTYNEIHRWGDGLEFNIISQIESVEIMSELVLDALKTDEFYRVGWAQNREYIESELPDDDRRRYFGYKDRKWADVFYRDKLKIAVTDNAILFGGKGAEFIDSTADIINNEDTLLAFLDWIYEGGDCPIMNNNINRLVKKFNTYPTSNDHLTRKNNRKKQ